MPSLAQVPTSIPIICKYIAILITSRWIVILGRRFWNRIADKARQLRAFSPFAPHPTTGPTSPSNPSNPHLSSSSPPPLQLLPSTSRYLTLAAAIAMNAAALIIACALTILLDLPLSILLVFATASVCTGPLVALFHGLDLRSGSGNIGATNMARVGGAKLGLITLAGDAAKGALLTTIIATSPLLNLNSGHDIASAAWIVCAVTIPHILPLWPSIQGGKGVAVIIGAVAMILPLWHLTAAATIWGALFAATRIVSLASIAAAWGLGCLIFLSTTATPSFYGASAALAIPLLITVTHRTNICRLIKGEEQPFRLAKHRHNHSRNATATNT